MSRPRRQGNGFTLLELLVTIVVLGVVLAVAMPSVKKYLESQRLRSVSGELLADLQFARGEAVARAQIVGLKFNSTDLSKTCYTIAYYTQPICARAGDGSFEDPLSTCDCRSGIGNACGPGNWVEIKTVNIPTSLGVTVQHMGGNPAIAFNPTSGGANFCTVNYSTGIPPNFQANTTAVSSGHTLRTQVTPSGRARTCVFSGTVAGVPAC